MLHDPQTHTRYTARQGATPTVSVIVPTKNSARHLRHCLESLHAQIEPALEVLVCDDSSSDGTVGIANDLGAIIVSAGPERSAQRNFAARHARGEALLFIDSDMQLQPGVIRSCIEQWRNGARAIIIPEVVIGRGLWARSRELGNRLHEGVPGYEGARFVDRSLFLWVGGYDERMVAGEDFDLHMSLVEAGGIEGAATTPIYHLEHELSLRDYIRKWRYYAARLDPFLDKRGQVRRRLPTLPRLVVQRWRLVAHDPLGFAGLVILKIIEFAIIGWRIRIPLRPDRARQ